MKKLLILLALFVGTLIPHTASAQFNGCMPGFCGAKTSAGAALACSYTPVTTGTQGTAYTGATPSASGGTPTYTFSETGSLPSGLTIAPSTGVISGTPSASGTFTGIQVKVTDSASTVANCGSAFTLTISAPSYVGPGDISSGAYAWYGLRGYTAAYATSLGNIADIVDTATGTFSCTIKAKANGDADLTSLSCTSGTLSVTTFCTVTHAAGCSISKLYDQTGNGRHQVQATLASMPTLVLNALGSLPMMSFSTQVTASGTSVYSVPTPYTISTVAKNNGTGVGILFFDDNNGNQLRYTGSTTVSINNNIFGTVTASTFYATQWFFASGTNNSSIFANGSSIASGAAVAVLWNGNTFIGGTSAAAANPFIGQVGEIGMWPSDVTANNSTMNSNQRTYWGF